MSDPRFPVECVVCEGPIEAEEDVVMLTGGWVDEEELRVPCHRECNPDA